MNKLFWSLVILDALMILGLALAPIIHPKGGGANVLDSLIGPVVAGLSILLVAISVAYWNTRSPEIHISLLILVGAPVVVAAPFGIIFLLGEMNQPKEYRLQIFDGDPILTKFMLAIYDLDFSKVRALAKQVDVNAVPPLRGTYRPLTLAVERAVEAQDKPRVADRALEMVRLLLSLGAKPNSGLLAACNQSSRTDAVRVLLDAGADPNNVDAGERPAFYGCFESKSEAVGLENLRLMAAKGANFKLTGNWPSPILIVASSGRWETVLYLHQSGVPLRVDREDRWIDSRAENDLADAKQKNREPTDALKRVAELLKE